MADATALAGQLLSAPDGTLTTAKWLLLGGVLSLAPALAVMTTSFVRISVVLGIVKHGFGGGQFLPSQAVTALSLFLTVAVMSPVWKTAYEAGVEPYSRMQFTTREEQQQAIVTAATKSLAPLRKFMGMQIEAAGNTAAVDLLLAYQSQATGVPSSPQFYEDLPISVLLPAYVLSELKVAFAIGFQLLLPFVVIDVVVASVINSLGLTALSASWASFPLKLLLFVLIDGWFLTVETLLSSIRPFTG